jgi:hypothetical protein
MNIFRQFRTKQRKVIVGILESSFDKSIPEIVDNILDSLNKVDNDAIHSGRMDFDEVQVKITPCIEDQEPHYIHPNICEYPAPILYGSIITVTGSNKLGHKIKMIFPVSTWQWITVADGTETTDLTQS